MLNINNFVNSQRVVNVGLTLVLFLLEQDILNANFNNHIQHNYHILSISLELVNDVECNLAGSIHLRMIGLYISTQLFFY